MLLLVGAGLLIRSFWLLERVSTGLEHRSRLTMRFPAGFRLQKSRRSLLFYNRLLDEVKALPGCKPPQ